MRACCLFTKTSNNQRDFHLHWDTSTCPDWGLPEQEWGTQTHLPEREEVYTQTHITVRLRPLAWLLKSYLTPSDSPDTHGGLDESRDSNSRENGSNQLTDGALVSTNTHGLSQKKRHSHCTTEARQVMLHKVKQVTFTCYKLQTGVNKVAILKIFPLTTTKPAPVIKLQTTPSSIPV